MTDREKRKSTSKPEGESSSRKRNRLDLPAYIDTLQQIDPDQQDPPNFSEPQSDYTITDSQGPHDDQDGRDYQPPQGSVEPLDREPRSSPQPQTHPHRHGNREPQELHENPDLYSDILMDDQAYRNPDASDADPGDEQEEVYRLFCLEESQRSERLCTRLDEETINSQDILGSNGYDAAAAAASHDQTAWDYEGIRTKLLRAKDQGLAVLIEEALAARGYPSDSWVGRVYRSEDVDLRWDIECQMVEILAATPPVLLQHIIGGDLPFASRREGPLKELLQENKDKKSERPGICVQYFTDGDGLSATVGEWRKMMDSMEIYCTENIANQVHRDMIIAIEAKFARSGTSIDPAARRYLQAGNTDNGTFVAHKAVIRRWIKATRKRLATYAVSHIIPPLSEVEYSNQPGLWLAQHEKHQSSNYIMNLAEATGQVLFPARGFHMDQFIIYHLHRREHAALGELLFTILANAYITHGGGFCHRPAGQSIASASKFTGKQWDEWVRLALDSECFKPGMVAETARLVALKKEEELKVKRRSERTAHLEALRQKEKQLEEQLAALRISKEAKVKERKRELWSKIAFK